MQTRRILFIILILFTGWWRFSLAQDEYLNHPELSWYTIATEHFQIHYHEGAERTARTVAKIAEDIYPPITRLYDWQPDGIIHFIIRDHDDNSNGAAFYYDNKVEIWAPQMTFILRGTHSWLRNVVTHEFAHMISLGASRKLPRKIPAFYFQWIGYEKEKRPDVLYGYPNVIASYPLPMTIMPMWLAEGMAQLQQPGMHYDLWDSHRDMLIRTAVLAGEQLSFTEMGVFGKNSLGNERTYNAGYALTRYIVHHWGETALKKMTDKLRRPLSFGVDGAIRAATGLSADQLYSRWQAEMTRYYQQRTAVIARHAVEGEMIITKGIGNTYPTWSPNGETLAYCGSKSSDYLTQTHLQLYSFKNGKKEVIKHGVNSAISWSADGKVLYYSRIERGKHGSHFSDIYRYDLLRKKEKQLTHDLRVFDPDITRDGERLICITQKDGTDNLLLLGADGTVIRPLTHHANGEALSSPRWSPDGRYIVFSQARGHGRDLMVLDVERDSSRALIRDQGDARDPVFHPDGHSIYFAWDKTGIFNIYSIDLHDGAVQQWTNVTGGAFMPAFSETGGLLFSNFVHDGYKIARLQHPQPVQDENSRYLDADNGAAMGLKEYALNSEPPLNRTDDDSHLPAFEAKPYEMTYGQVSLLPRVMMDYKTLKLGTYFYASDILDRYSMFGGAGLNSKLDLDAFAIFEMRRFDPTYFLELYAFTRHIERDIEVIEDLPETAQVDIGFTILEADLGARYQPADGQMLRAAYAHSRYISKIGEFFFRGAKWVSPQNTYFIGNQFSLTWTLDGAARGLDSDINPAAGRRVELKYSYELNQFFEDFATDNKYNTPQEVYTDYNYHRIELNWSEYLSMPWYKRHTLTTQLRAGWIDRPVDDFFNFFAGGLPGLRGYPFYSIEGRKLLLLRSTQRIPIFSGWQKRFLHLTSRSSYLSGFVEVGNAFNQDRIDLDQLKWDAGAFLRMAAFSFYGYPTALEFTAAYGFNRIENRDITYGKEWRYYLTLLFDFID
ncbi:PD40 domain-containing protein [candidate division KSB1 bacterium]|nr:PD40 domain-containing protein [candidate division KSB1 bacterium]